MEYYKVLSTKTLCDLGFLKTGDNFKNDELNIYGNKICFKYSEIEYAPTIIDFILANQNEEDIFWIYDKKSAVIENQSAWVYLVGTDEIILRKDYSLKLQKYFKDTEMLFKELSNNELTEIEKENIWLNIEAMEKYHNQIQLTPFGIHLTKVNAIKAIKHLLVKK